MSHADLNNDGIVDIFDLSILLSEWGPVDGGTTLLNGFTRESLLTERAGFGEAAGGTGGSSADDALTWTEYQVTNTNIDATGAGTLRDALTAEQRWITFSPGMTINQATGSSIDLIQHDRWVLDGRGANITIQTAGSTNFYLERCTNWIMTGLRFELQSGAASGSDMITNEAPDHWWVHKCTFVGIGPDDGGATGDGALDTGGISVSGTDYRPGQGTVSWCEFLDHGKLSLAVWETVNGETPLPSTDSARPKYTYHHNLFRNNRQRQPLIRASLGDIVNNWFDGWGNSTGDSGQCVQSQDEAYTLVRNNIWDTGANGRNNATNTSGGPVALGWLRDGGGNTTTGGATITTNDTTPFFDPGTYYTLAPDTADQNLRDAIAANAGA